MLSIPFLIEQRSLIFDYRRHNITFTLKDFSQQPKHFIFVLDESTSMDKDPWAALLQAVQKFVQVKMLSKIQHTASCIAFAAKARVVFSTRPLGPHLFNAIELYGGMTNFAYPLQEVIKLLKSSPTDSLNVIIFMTDGLADYPKKEIAELNKAEIWQKIDSFWAILFGTDSDGKALLNDMAMNVKSKGKFKNPTQLDELVASYVEIAKLT